jgi:hypothetical protein
VLPDDGDERITADPDESPERRPRVVRDPRDEFRILLARAKKDIDSVVDRLPMVKPSKNTAIKLSKMLRELYDMTERYERIEKAGRRKILEDFRDATLGASIAAERMTKDKLTIDDEKDVFKHLRHCQLKLEAVLRAYGSAGR